MYTPAGSLELPCDSVVPERTMRPEASYTVTPPVSDVRTPAIPVRQVVFTITYLLHFDKSSRYFFTFLKNEQAHSRTFFHKNRATDRHRYRHRKKAPTRRYGEAGAWNEKVRGPGLSVFPITATLFPIITVTNGTLHFSGIKVVCRSPHRDIGGREYRLAELQLYHVARRCEIFFLHDRHAYLFILQ